MQEVLTSTRTRQSVCMSVTNRLTIRSLSFFIFASNSLIVLSDCLLTDFITRWISNHKDTTSFIRDVKFSNSSFRSCCTRIGSNSSNMSLYMTSPCSACYRPFVRQSKFACRNHSSSTLPQTFSSNDHHDFSDTPHIPKLYCS